MKISVLVPVLVALSAPHGSPTTWRTYSTEAEYKTQRRSKRK
jgi:hypothetical protein